MREKNVGALVVLDKASGQLLVGIVTERDIVRNFEKISKEDTLPIKSVMTSEVVTLPVGDLHKAAALMLERGFRHIVFTYDNDGNRRRVAGIASVRDLLREAVRGLGTRLTPFAKLPETVVLFSDSSDSKSLFKGLLNQMKQSTLETFSPADLSGTAKVLASSAVFVDIDHVALGTWPVILKALLALQNRPKKIVVLYTASGHPENTLEVLAHLSKSKALAVVEKPLSLGVILGLLRE